ncbi:hypothetical protein RBU55_18675 [Pseudomonas chlororaphis subsp. aurantiaca]|uniref:hypothetical protein n=1 Tax=Pseudomonas chlororaphis TaxID=587753 RepID=UPI0027DBB6AE|nr:hypothetical protein [Pseudomonas chlororaphis]WMI97587.1 hypothetical protein RBU55_18675 [Pseudomonas chlororaphis subsp. aurantiaca]
MKVVHERSTIASYDLGMRTQAQLREAAPQRRARNAQAVSTGPSARPSGKMADLSLQVNQQLSSVQSAHSYLTQVSEQLKDLKRDLGRSIGAAKSSTPDLGGLARSVTSLNKLLDNRSRLSAASLDAQLGLSLDEPLRSRFSIKGLETIPAVLASGSETLLFNAGRHMPGPIAVVLDDDMSAAQLLRRFNTSLAQAGLHAEVNENAQLRFSAAEPQWRKLKGQLSVQGEDKLFSKTGFTPVRSQEDNLLGEPLVVPQTYERTVLRCMLETVDNGLTQIKGVVEQLNMRQAQATGQLGRHENKDEQRWVHDFTARLFNSSPASTTDYSRVAQVVVCQANVSRKTVMGLLS